MVRAVVILGVLAACGGGGPPPVVEAQPEPPKPVPETAAPRACITPSDDVTAIATASTDGSSVRFCIGTEGTECFALDVGTRKFSKLAERPKPKEQPFAYVETVNPDIKVCASDVCKSLAQKVIPNAAKIRAATNAFGSIAVFLLGDAAAGKGYAEIWDVATTTRVATFKYARGAFKCGDVTMLGETIYLSTSTCRQPAARATLYNTKGKKIANVGGPDFGVFGNAFAQIDGSTWAFLEENATAVAIQDVIKGKIKKSISLKPLLENASMAMANPGESALVRLDNGMLAVIIGAPATGSVGLIDPNSGKLEVLRPPSC